MTTNHDRHLWFGSLEFINRAVAAWATPETVALALLDVLMFVVYLWAASLVFINLAMVPIDGLPVLLWMQNGNAMDTLFMDFPVWFVRVGLLIMLVGMLDRLWDKD